MPHDLWNWSYRDVKDFLGENGFVFYKEKDGSHEAWIDSTSTHVVEINKIKNSDSYIIRTLETMIRQSGIDKKAWKKWANS